MRVLDKRVDIILPVYNGEQYLCEQINSILEQSDPNWRLIIRDDGSRDNSVDIIKEYILKYPDRIILLTDNKGNLGIMNNVFEILRYTDSDYIMFCDQDDVWFPDKVRILKRCILTKEAGNPDIPILVHSEALITDHNLNLVGRSPKEALFSVQNQCRKEKTSFVRLLFLNVIQGASMIFNRALYEKLEPLFGKKLNKGVYHDSVIASVASICGKIYFYGKPLMYYRQHANNLVGARQLSLLKWSQYSDKEKNRIRSNHYLNVNHIKCELLYKFYQSEMKEEQLRTIESLRKAPIKRTTLFQLGLQRDFSISEIMSMMVFGVK